MPADLRSDESIGYLAATGKVLFKKIIIVRKQYARRKTEGYFLARRGNFAFRPVFPPITLNEKEEKR